ncbi:hypothetical protein BJX76DRAFT_354262 [Aspergillus varians]
MSSDGSLVDEKPEAAKGDSNNILGSFRGPIATSDTDIKQVESAPGEVSLVEPPVKQKKSQRLRRHFVRFWCCYVFWAVIFLAIFLPVFFLVVIPAVAQLVVSKSSLLLVSARIVEPRADSILLSLEAALNLGVVFPVRIEPLTLAIYNRDVDGNNTIFQSTIDATRIHGNATLGIQNVSTPVNVPLWTEFVHRAVFEKDALLPVKGETNAYIGILKSHVKVDKEIHLNALNSFAGFSIDKPKLLLPAQEDGTNLIANATLFNPSVMELEIGTTILDLKTGDYILGNATIDNLVLYPGNNSVAINGMIDLHYLIDNLHEILEIQRHSISRGFLSLDCIGRSVVWGGEEVPYYTVAMKELTLKADVSLGSLVINTIQGVIAPNGTNIFSNLTNPDGPSNIHDIVNSIDDPDAV